MALKLLIIDDHTLFRSGLMTLLEHRNIEVSAVGSGSEGLGVLENSDLDIVFSKCST